MLKGILVAAADKEWELIAIRVEEVAEVETVALRSLIGRETGARREVEAAIMAIYAFKSSRISSSVTL